MNELIPLHDYDGKKAVSARDLHSFLESKRDFSAWIKQRITKYGLIENQDYIVFTQMGENLSGGRPTIEYALTLDAAKELSMVEGNAKGRKARKYFIACEKQLKSMELTTKDPEEALLQSVQLLVEHRRMIKAIETRQTAIEATVNEIKEVQKQNTQQLLSLPISSEPAKPISLRKQISMLVSQYALAMNVPYSYVWLRMYSDLEARYNIRLGAYKKIRPDEKPIDIADRIKVMDKLYIIISSMIREIPQRA